MEIIGWVNFALKENALVRPKSEEDSEDSDREESTYVLTAYLKNSVTSAVEPLRVIA
jgi:hypothetical protein